MIIRLKAITDGDDFDLRVTCTQGEWDALTALAVKNNWPIDGSTVDTEILDELMSRPRAKGKARHTVLLV